MISLLLSLLASAPSAASLTCPEGPASCDAAWMDIVAEGVEAEAGAPREYATPAEIDCPAPAATAPAGTGPDVAEIGECDLPPDLWWRASRLADGPFRRDGGLAAGRQRRDTRTTSSFDPPREPASVTAPDLQPVALFAVPHLALEERPVQPGSPEERLPERALAPPDRPPRV